MTQRHRRRCLAVLATTAIVGAAQAATTTRSGKAPTDIRSVSGFHAISMRGDIDVIVRQGSIKGVQVRADDGVVKLGTLASEGSGNVSVEALKTPALALNLSGSSQAKLRQLKTEQLSIHIASSGDASVTAQKTLGVAIAGSGDVEYGGAATLAKRSVVGSGTVGKRQP